MATLKRLPSGHWHVQIYRTDPRSKQRIRRATTFIRKKEAEIWAAEIEIAIEKGTYLAPEEVEADRRTFGDLLKEYSKKVTPKKRGARWEQIRINALLRDPIADIRLKALGSPNFADWRDRRLLHVSNASVTREMNLLSHVCRVGWREWKWLSDNPMTDVRRPPPTPPRNRRITDEEIARIVHCSGYSPDQPLETVSSRVGATFLFAIETAMRIGEICRIEWKHLSGRILFIPKTKTTVPRSVPLSRKAMAILEQLKPSGFPVVFGLTPRQVDALFRRIKGRTGIENLHFHDTRREALSRLSKKMGPMELAKISGHRDLKIMLSVYYAPTAEDLVELVD